MTDTKTPSVEERLMYAEQNAALLARMNHATALSRGELSNDHEQPAAWCSLRLAEEILGHLRAINEALAVWKPDPRQLDAPEVQ